MRRTSTLVAFECVFYCLCLLGIWQVAGKANLPFSLAVEKGGRIVVTALSLGAKSDGIRPGDFIISIEGSQPHSLEDIEFILDGVRVGNRLPVEVRRSGGVLQFQVESVNYYSPVYVVVAFSVGTIFFLSGVFVFWRKKDDMAAIVYHFGAIAAAGVIMMTWGSFAVEPLIFGQLVRCGFSASYAFLPVLFLNFSLLFPEKMKSFSSGILVPAYFASVALSVLMGFALFRATTLASLQWFHTFLVFFDITRWFFVACTMLAVAIFVNSYRTAHEELQRRQLRWVILGLALSSLGFVTLWEVPELLTSRGLIREEFVVLLSSASPIAFTVAIVKYHVLDIDYILNRSTVYVIVVTILLIVYALIVGAAAGLVSQFTIRTSISISAIAAIVVALLFEPLRRHVQVLVDKNFFRLSYDMQIVETHFMEQLKNCVSAEDVAELLVETCSNTIPVDKIGFFLLEETGNRLHIVAHRNYDILVRRTVKFEYDKLKTSLPVPVAVEDRIEPGIEFEIADRDVFDRWGMAIVFPMKSEHGNILGFLVLGIKKSGTRFSKEDVGVLKFLAEQAGYAYERIILQSRLIIEHEERERLEELNRMKTYFVSSVSHDLKTPLTSITMLAEMIRSTPKIPTVRLRRYIDTIEGESNRLGRLIDNVLSVARSERGKAVCNPSPVSLNSIVKHAVEATGYEVRKENCKVHLKTSLKHDRIYADQDGVTEAICNLISNAVQYSPKRKSVLISTFARNGYSCVSVKDSGIGIPREELSKLFEPFYRGKASSQLRPGGTGIGLSVVKNIMDAHEGKIEIKSVAKVGTEVTLLFPMTETK